MTENTPVRFSRKAMLALGGALVVALAASSIADEVRWRSAEFVEAGAKTIAGHQSVSDALTSLSRGSDVVHVVVHVEQAVSDRLRTELADAGVVLLDYLGDNAFFARVDSDRLDTAAIEKTRALSGAAAIDPIVKLHPFLASGETPEWAVVNADSGERPIIGAYVKFHRDIDLATEAAPLMELYGANIRDALETINALVVEVELDAIDALADEDAVQWIEQALPRMSFTNNSNRIITQVNDVQAAPYDLDGTGVTVLVYDGGTARATHVDFGGRCSALDGSGQHYHSTHVAATIGGDGSASGGTYKGMAPNTTILSYGFEYDGSGTFLYTNPGDLEADYAAAISMGADIANNSIGTNTESNGFPCSYQGQYGLTSSLIDKIVRGDGSDPDFPDPFRIVWANGNERQGDRCDVEGHGDYYSTAPPAGAKNHLAIGALNSNNDSMTYFSSWGPVNDGRMKPDFCSAGCQSNDDNGVTSADSSSDTSYTTLCGTSMASPTVCGIAALLIEDYRTQFPADPDPRNSTLKILFAQTAADLGNTGPDHQYGYGSVRTRDAIDFMRQGSFYEDEVTQGGSLEFFVEVTAGDSELKVTLAWDDYPGTPNVDPALVNDLDLRVYDPSDARHYPWTLDLNNPGGAAVRTQENHIDNIEQVFVNSPAVGTWRIEISGTTVPEGPQSFSICAGPNLVPTGIRFAFPDGLPTLMAPGVSETFGVEITSSTETILPGTETLHFRYDGGSYISVPLTNLGGGSYEATLPPPVCGATPEFYISVEGSVSGLVTRPTDVGANPFTAEVGVFTVAVNDEFESDAGWTVGSPDDDATTGIWNRGDPEGTDAQPEDDHTVAGVNCFATDTRAGSGLGTWDIDDGQTTLTSPVLDLTGLNDPFIGYYRWYSNDTGATPNTDIFVIDMSTNAGGSWFNIETVGPSGAGTSGGWIYHELRVADFVTPTNQMQLRFIASDEGDGSLVEAALDDFQVFGMECSATLDDCNGNGIVDSDDIASGRSTDNNGNGVPDECDSVGCPGDVDFDGDIDLEDLAQLLSNFGTTSGATFEDGDLNGDGDVDLNDLAELLAVFGTFCV